MAAPDTDGGEVEVDVACTVGIGNVCIASAWNLEQ